jgi:hypothetical protein
VGGGGKVTASPFLLNQVILNVDRNYYAYILKAITFGIIFILPLFALVLIQWRFSAYHSLVMTIGHFVAVVVDVFFLFMYRYRITRRDMHGKDYDLLWMMVKVNFGKTFILEKFLIVLISFVAIVNLVITILVIRYVITKPYIQGEKWIVPHLELAEQTLVASPPSDTIIQAYLMNDKSKDDAWRDYAKGLDLKDRNLNLANFGNANLSKADLRYASLQGADLSNTSLTGAFLEQVDLICIEVGDFKENNLEGILFKIIEMHPTPSLDEAFKGLISSDNESNNKRVTAAKERCKKFDDKSINDLTAIFNRPQHNNKDKFIKERLELSCEDYDIAKGLLSQNLNFNNFAIEIDYAPYMQKNCPDLYNRLKTESPDLFKLSQPKQ